jgi:glycosyltransferase involved in cell wall biosynthesis
MKVVLDVTIFGLANEWESARSGIFRVVEQTALGLADRQNLDLRLCSAESWWNYDQTRTYLRQSSTCSEKLLLPNNIASNSLVSLHRVSERPIAGPRHANISARILRRFAGAIVKRFSPLPASALRGRDILHSGYLPLPENSRGIKNLHRFLTIYDLVPILFPHTVTAHTREIFGRILASIGPDVHCLCISDATKNDLCEHLSLTPDRVTVTPLAASRELFFPVKDTELITLAMKQVGVPAGAKYLLCVNTLQPLKNISTAIRAFAAFVQETRADDLYFVLVGGRGWAFQQILEEVANCNLAKDRIVVAGYVADNQLAPLYSGALAFLYPSLYEGFGLPPLEAMQCGTPVITGSAPAFQEVIGSNGIMVDAANRAEISQAIADLYSNTDLRTRKAEAGLERAREFTWNNYGNRVLGAYGAALASR